jgi:pyruvate formate lyase activating enzyme
VDNDLILVNLRRLAEIRAPVTVRVPLIPGFNADSGSLSAIARFVVEQDGMEKHVSLLPYHTLGKAKYASLGRPYPWEDHPRLSQEQVQDLAQVMEAYGLEVSIGS